MRGVFWSCMGACITTLADDLLIFCVLSLAFYHHCSSSFGLPYFLILPLLYGFVFDVKSWCRYKCRNRNMKLIFDILGNMGSSHEIRHRQIRYAPHLPHEAILQLTIAVVRRLPSGLCFFMLALTCS